MAHAKSALLLIAALAATGCHTAAGPKPLDQLTPAESAGRQVFAARCSSCHYDRVAQPLHGPALRGLYRKPYLPSGAPANDDRVSATIQQGRGMMPGQGTMDAQDLDNLLAYLHTL